jgi:hypothetical protein
MKTIISMAVLCISMIGCFEEYVAPIRAPGGTEKYGFSFACRDITDCYKWAGNKCPDGYEVITKGDHTLMIECDTTNGCPGTQIICDKECHNLFWEYQYKTEWNRRTCR